MSFTVMKDHVSKIVYGQFVLMLVPDSLMGLFRHLSAGFSAFAGSIACWLPTLFFAKILFGRLRSGKNFLIIFIAGEFVRLFLSGILFICVVRFLTYDIIAATAGFIAAIVAFWIVSVSLVYD